MSFSLPIAAAKESIASELATAPPPVVEIPTRLVQEITAETEAEAKAEVNQVTTGAVMDTITAGDVASKPTLMNTTGK